jgi:SnoaL-like domain
MTPRAFAESYVEIVNRGAYDELAALFAPEAVFLAPGARVLHGRSAIGRFYEEFLGEIKPTIRVSSYVEQGCDCVYELEARLAGEQGFRLGAVDHATFDKDGQVVRFAVFTK